MRKPYQRAEAGVNADFEEYGASPAHPPFSREADDTGPANSYDLTALGADCLDYA